MKSSTRRIARNTLMLYFRQILIMAVNLYTVRIVLQVLGAEDYGIYTLVGGIISMFSFFTVSMALATQRYLAVEMENGDDFQLKKTFSVTLQIYFFIAVLVVIIAETFGVWFVNNRLVIPNGRMLAANCVFQSAVISFLLTILTSPFMAAIVAHELMDVYAYVSITEALMKFFIIICLKLFHMDKLILYSILHVVISFATTSMYRLFCRLHFSECRLSFIFDSNLFKNMLKYNGWNFLGKFSTAVSNQGISVLLNLFFGVALNASRGIAGQISSTLLNFSNNFSVALRPQIIKTWAAGRKNESYNLVYKGSKTCFFLLFIPSVPILLNIDYILLLWLKSVPQYTPFFVRLIIGGALIDCVGNPLLALMHANGNMKAYMCFTSLITLLNIPLSFAFLKSGFPPHIVFIVSIFLSFIRLLAKLLVLNLMTGLSLFEFLKNTLFRICVVATPTFLLLILLGRYFYCKKIITLLWESVLTLFFVCNCIFFAGLSKYEKKRVLEIVLAKLKGFKNER